MTDSMYKDLTALMKKHGYNLIMKGNGVYSILKKEPEQPTHEGMNEFLEYIFQPGDTVKSISTGKMYTVEETEYEGMKVYLLPRKQSDERLYNFAYELTLIQRKPEPKQPTHEEIMTKWWNNGSMWIKIIAYENGAYWIFDKLDDTDLNEFTAVRAIWFTDHESADMPPEGV